MTIFAGLPGMVMSNADAYWFISHRPAPGDNILRAHWNETEAEQRIDQTLAEVGEHVREIGWMVFPSDRPTDLGRRLMARGLPEGLAGNWLWADLAQMPPAPPVKGNFRMRPVRDDEALKVWVMLSEAGFDGELGWYFDAYARHGYGPDACSEHFIGYAGDTPVTTATLLTAVGSAALYDVSTPPAHRQQGFGGAITYALMQLMRARGQAGSWIWSSGMARPLYQQLGYVDCDFGVREYTWRRAPA
jgi:hypothetical protein